MIKTNVNAMLIPVSDIETTCMVHNVYDLNQVLKFTTCNGYNSKALMIEVVEFGEVGFERKSDWIRFVNKLEKHDITPIKRMLVGDKDGFDNGEMVIKVTDINYSNDGFEIEFKKGVKIVIEQIGDNYLCVEIKKIKGDISWEWYSRIGHKELGDYAGICEIYLNNIVIVE
jgi:hypothetical protein